MCLRRRLTIAVLSLCGGAAVAGTVLFGFRARQMVHIQPVTMPTREDLTLRNVQIFFRHGARTPLTNLKGLEEVRMCKYFFTAVFFGSGSQGLGLGIGLWLQYWKVQNCSMSSCTLDTA